MWMHHDFFSLLSVKGHLRCFQFWIMMNKAMVKTHIQVFVGTHVASMDYVINTYAQLLHYRSAWLYHFASPPACVRVPHSHQHFAIVRLKKILALLTSVLWYPVVVLIYISLIINNVDHLFLCVYLPLYIFFSEVSFKSFAFLFELGSFCIIKFWEFFEYPRYASLRRYVFCDYLLLVWGLSSCFLNNVSQRVEVFSFEEVQFIIFFLSELCISSASQRSSPIQDFLPCFLLALSVSVPLSVFFFNMVWVMNRESSFFAYRYPVFIAAFLSFFLQHHFLKRLFSLLEYPCAFVDNK